MLNLISWSVASQQTGRDPALRMMRKELWFLLQCRPSGLLFCTGLLLFSAQFAAVMRALPHAAAPLLCRIGEVVVFVVLQVSGSGVKSSWVILLHNPGPLNTIYLLASGVGLLQPALSPSSPLM